VTPLQRGNYKLQRLVKSDMTSWVSLWFVPPEHCSSHCLTVLLLQTLTAARPVSPTQALQTLQALELLLKVEESRSAASTQRSWVSLLSSVCV